jgi:hypothetical protein
MNETDIKDKRGNIIISPGLKVRLQQSTKKANVRHLVSVQNVR